jgi:hypothetical protein
MIEIIWDNIGIPSRVIKHGYFYRKNENIYEWGNILGQLWLMMAYSRG